MNIARTVLTAAALVGAAGSANAATSIVTNGSFENGAVIPPAPNGFLLTPAGSPNITGWTVGGNSVDYIGSFWQASAGVRSVDLAGTGPGTLSQMLTTVIGQLYSVTFDISKNPDAGQVPRLGTASAAGQSLALSYSAPNTRANMMWQTVSFSFVALTQSTLLTFAADGPSSANGSGLQAFGLAIDNVSVVAAPEPATWALMILGFGIVGSALRRRRRTQVRFNFA